ncbi:MAG: agmatine deiminase family protein [Methanolinea sp.]|nr:agmatine deiminase family protein [Methanolinea sp.]
METGIVRIGLIQTSAGPDTARNLERNLELARSALAQGARIVCLQELFATPYFPQFHRFPVENYADKVPGKVTALFSPLAREHGAVIILPLFEAGEGGTFYNSAITIMPDGTPGTVYRKVHVPEDPLYYEKEYFSPGSGYAVQETPFGRVAVLICYDQWFAEAARVVTLMGADIIFYPTALGTIRGMEDPLEGDWARAWETVQRGHAIGNGIHVAAVNRVGTEGDITFFGRSFVCDAFGNVVARAGDKDQVLIADVDLSMNRHVREGWGFLSNRRPDTYSLITRSCPPFTGTTPAAAGFRMPAEWEPHQGVWLSWPYENDTFPDLSCVEKAYGKIIRALSGRERVYLLVRDEEMEKRVRDTLSRVGIAAWQVHFVRYRYADVWFRDYGPIFLVHRKDPRIAMVNWTFNAWGGKYPELTADDKIPDFLANYLGIPSFFPGMVLEGGSIDTDGHGTLLVTEQCLLHPNRNPDLSRSDIEARLRDFLGVARIVWLKGGIAGDDTDGHVDDVARFVNPHTVVCAVEKDRGSENYRVLWENHSILEAARSFDGRPLEVVDLPMPGKMDDVLPASYTNFYIGNGIVIFPEFNDPADRQARKVLARVFPGRTIAGVNCSEMVRGFGAIHCISQQFPSP